MKGREKSSLGVRVAFYVFSVASTGSLMWWALMDVSNRHAFNAFILMVQGVIFLKLRLTGEGRQTPTSETRLSDVLMAILFLLLALLICFGASEFHGGGTLEESRWWVRWLLPAFWVAISLQLAGVLVSEEPVSRAGLGGLASGWSFARRLGAYLSVVGVLALLAWGIHRSGGEFSLILLLVGMVLLFKFKRTLRVQPSPADRTNLPRVLRWAQLAAWTTCASLLVALFWDSEAWEGVITLWPVLVLLWLAGVLAGLGIAFDIPVCHRGRPSACRSSEVGGG